jgi:hypothetical protein
MRETILNKLKQEHRQVEFLMAQIEHCHDVAQKKDLYLELEALLLAHMEGEERTLYSELKLLDTDEAAFQLANRADQEHRLVKELMASLDQIGIENQEWKRLFDELKMRILEHVEEEETELFAEAKDDFSSDELADFAEEFEKLKHQISL